MGSLNRVMLIGNLGADPEVRYAPSGQAVANFRIATSEQWTDKGTGAKQERTEWHRIVAWGKTAELVGEYLKKGRQCFVEGRLQTRDWTDKENVKRYTTEIVADRVVFLGGRGMGADVAGAATGPGAGVAAYVPSNGSGALAGPAGPPDGSSKDAPPADDDLPF